MAQITLNAEVRAVARELGVPIRGDVAAQVVAKCLKRVASWCDELGMPGSLEELLDIVQARLCLRFEVIGLDGDLGRVREKYLRERELAFVNLDEEFSDGTDAIVFRLEHAKPWSNCRYVAVIDGRGAKAARVWFSKWHEIAHLLAEPQTKFVFRRTTAFKREPLERLMDQIAGALAFYEPLFRPALDGHGIDLLHPRLRDLRDFATARCGFASLQSALHSALNYVQTPAILIEAKLALKRSEARLVDADGRDAGDARPLLRAVTTAHNPAALRVRFYVHRNMRVPERSVIARVFSGEAGAEFEQTRERLGWWESGGEKLNDLSISVEAMKAGNSRVLALCLLNKK